MHDGVGSAQKLNYIHVSVSTNIQRKLTIIFGCIPPWSTNNSIIKVVQSLNSSKPTKNIIRRHCYTYTTKRLAVEEGDGLGKKKLKG